MESMDDYKEELEASLKKIRVGDVVTGTVLDVTDDAVIVDLKTYADGVIRKEDLSDLVILLDYLGSSLSFSGL